MRRVSLVVFLLAVGWAGVARASMLDGSVYLMPIGTQFTSVARAEYLNDLMHRENATLTGTHSVQGPQNFETPVQGTGLYTNDLEGPADPGVCYGTTLFVRGESPRYPLPTLEKTWTGDARCAPSSPGGGGCGSNGGTCEQSESCPLILDLNDDGIHTTGLDDPVDFWIDLQGRSETTAWTNPHTEEAFLWMDLDRDHVAQVTELFGSRMVAPNGVYYANGFDALRIYDRRAFGGNADGWITMEDGVWPRLRLWVDRNHDAISQPTEISVPSSHGIVALDLAHAEGDEYDENGNELYLVGSYVVRVHGRDAELRTMADVEFRYIPN